MSKSLATRLEKLERHSPPEPLVVRITSFADPPSPEEEAVLEAEVQRRLAAGENLVLMYWSREHARKLGAPEPAARKPKDGKLGVTFVCEGRPSIEL